MKKSLKLFSIASLLFIATNCFADINQNQLQANIQKVLKGYLNKNKNSEHISAIAVTISPAPGVMYNYQIGTTEFNNQGNPITANSLFEIGSITKSFTSVIILKLAEKGKLNLDDSLTKYLPEYPQWQNVTIRQLLNMTSGIPNYNGSPQWTKEIVKNVQRQYTPAEIVQTVVGKPMNSGYHYSNTNYILLGMIAEKASGKPFVELMRNLISQIGLQNTYYYQTVYPESILKNMVSGYNNTMPHFKSGTSDPTCSMGSQTTDIKCMNMSREGAAGAIVSNTENVTRWIRQLFTIQHDDVGILNANQYQQLTSIVSTQSGTPINKANMQGKSGYGLGVMVTNRGAMGNVWNYQGETIGFRTRYAYFPTQFNSGNGQGLIITVALNSQPTSNNDHTSKLIFRLYNAVKQAGNNP